MSSIIIYVDIILYILIYIYLYYIYTALYFISHYILLLLFSSYRYISDRDFDPNKIKSASTACEGICRWVCAMDVYDKVARIVMPKKAALEGAESELKQQMETLNAKRAELQVILDKLQKLNDFFAEKSREKKRLEDDIDNCEKKLTR